MIQKFADTVTFSADRHSYSRSSIESIQLLHYKSLDSGYMLTDTALPKHALSCLDSSEIVIFYDQQEPRTETEDINRSVLHCIVPCFHTGVTTGLINVHSKAQNKSDMQQG
jgi:hypothetical protein